MRRKPGQQGSGSHRVIPASMFKASCLKLMDEVRRRGIRITVTKRGKPVVTVIPAHEEAPAGSLRGTIVFEAEDIFSTGERFEAEE